jgi:hypothetical protein
LQGRFVEIGIGIIVAARLAGADAVAPAPPRTLPQVRTDLNPPLHDSRQHCQYAKVSALLDGQVPITILKIGDVIGERELIDLQNQWLTVRALEPIDRSQEKIFD